MNKSLFGCDISLSNNIIVVGNPSIGSKGCIYTYRIEPNNEEYDENDPLYPYNGHINDGFGMSLKIHSINYNEYLLIIGSHRKVHTDISSGSAYIYYSTDNCKNWKFIQELIPERMNQSMFFGCSVDINDNTAIIGAYGDNSDGFKSGSVSIFNQNIKDKWVLTHTLYPNMYYNPKVNTFSSMYFGFSVALNNNFMIIGAPSENSDGSIYILNSNNSWNDINSYCINGSTNFGFSVAINYDKFLIGSPGGNGENGKAYIYDISSIHDIENGIISYKQHIPRNIITTKSKSSKSLFGRSVAFTDKFSVISGYGKIIDSDKFVGSAFLYSHKLYESQNNIEAISYIRDKNSEELFGHSVDINDKYVIVGDPMSNTVHVYLINDLIGSSIKTWKSSNITIKTSNDHRIEIV